MEIMPKISPKSSIPNATQNNPSNNHFIGLWKEFRPCYKGGQMVGEDILLEIDGTLDQLIRNAEVIEKVDLKDLSETEIEAFKKTQESLLQHLMHMDEFFAAKRNDLKLQDKKSATFKIQEKLLKFEKMKTSYHKSLSQVERKMPILSKRRTKRLLESWRG